MLYKSNKNSPEMGRGQATCGVRYDRSGSPWSPPLTSGPSRNHLSRHLIGGWPTGSSHGPAQERRGMLWFLLESAGRQVVAILADGMSFLGAFSQTFAAGPDPAGVYTPYYAHGPAGETFYVWPATFSQSPDLSPGSAEYSPPPYSGSPAASTPACFVGTVDNGCNPPVRSVKRRVTANRKERRRTLSINNAFSELRDCIPNVPQDTKLSKIKILRLSTSYIAYLMDVLAQDEPAKTGQLELQQPPSFKVEVGKTETREERRKQEQLTSLVNSCVAVSDRKSRGRTGWPQHVWASELKPENPT